MGREDVKSPISLSNLDESFAKSEKSLEKSCSEVNYKTELCRTWVEKNYCPYKEKCRFAHGKKDLHEKSINSKHYKQKECNSFYKKGFCPYGPRCHFKHEERRLEDITRPYYQCIIGSPRNLEKIMRRNLNLTENIFHGNEPPHFWNDSGPTREDHIPSYYPATNPRCHYNKIFQDSDYEHREINDTRTLPVFKKINSQASSPVDNRKENFSHNSKQTRNFESM